MTNITTKITREKLKKKEYDVDSVVIFEPKVVTPVSEEEFYAATVKLLALIYLENSDEEST